MNRFLNGPKSAPRSHTLAACCASSLVCLFVFGGFCSRAARADDAPWLQAFRAALAEGDRTTLRTQIQALVPQLPQLPPDAAVPLRPLWQRDLARAANVERWQPVLSSFTSQSPSFRRGLALYALQELRPTSSAVPNSEHDIVHGSLRAANLVVVPNGEPPRDDVDPLIFAALFRHRADNGAFA